MEMKMEPDLEGGCLCGAVRYRVSERPLLVEYCHCSMCRRAAGAPVVVWADFPRSSVTWTKGSPSHYTSSANVRRGFCATCGSALTFDNQHNIQKISLTVGTLDHPEKLAPRQHIYSEEHMPWLNLEDSLPRFSKGEE